MTGTGDPASTSALGGALRSQALVLADLGAELASAARATERRGGLDVTARERGLLETTARELDAVGATLQAWTAAVAEGASRLRSLASEAAAADLEIVGSHVVDLPGPSRVDPVARSRARERLQELLNRVTAAQGRELGRIAREVGRSAPVLAAVSERARTGS